MSFLLLFSFKASYEYFKNVNCLYILKYSYLALKLKYNKKPMNNLAFRFYERSFHSNSQVELNVFVKLHTCNTETTNVGVTSSYIFFTIFYIRLSSNIIIFLSGLPVTPCIALQC